MWSALPCPMVPREKEGQPCLSIRPLSLLFVSTDSGIQNSPNTEFKRQPESDRASANASSSSSVISAGDWVVGSGCSWHEDTFQHYYLHWSDTKLVENQQSSRMHDSFWQNSTQIVNHVLLTSVVGRGGNALQRLWAAPQHTHWWLCPHS